MQDSGEFLLKAWKQCISQKKTKVMKNCDTNKNTREQIGWKNHHILLRKNFKIL